MSYILVIDQGTTSTRVIIFNEKGQDVAQHQIPLTQYYPKPGWVEHDPEEIWHATLECARLALQRAELEAAEINSIGITNQRETTIVWDRDTGKPIYRAIVWQDRRTAEMCNKLREHEDSIQQKTGLILDPYFSASKIHWVLQNVDGAQAKAEAGRLAFGTVETFLLWRLTSGKSHMTDVTNASRTMLLNIPDLRWSVRLCKLFNIPEAILPEIKPNTANFGVADKKWFGAEIPVTAMIGDQQSAAIGQACIKPGMMKSTYGTGCFMLMNTGNLVIHSQHRLLTTVAYSVNGDVNYAIEGSIFIAGAAIQWLRDNLGLVAESRETEKLASSVADNGGVYFIPAFTGLGAPYWQPEVRGAIFGLTRDTQKAHLVRAALEAVCYRTKDLIEAISQDGVKNIETLRVDGGMSKNNWMLQYLADMLKIPVERAENTESTALGAAFLAGLHSGIYSSLQDINKIWQGEAVKKPNMDKATRAQLYQAWQKYISKLT